MNDPCRREWLPGSLGPSLAPRTVQRIPGEGIPSVAHDPIKPLPSLTRDPLAAVALRSAQSQPTPPVVDSPEGANPAPLSAMQVLDLLAGNANAINHVPPGVLLNLSRAALAQGATAISPSKAQAIAELLAFLQDQHLVVPALVEPTWGNGGEALWKAFLSKAAALGLIEEDLTQAGSKIPQDGSVPGAPAATQTIQQKIDALLQTLRASAETLVGKAASLWAAGPTPSPSAGLPASLPSPETSGVNVPFIPAEESSLPNQPLLQAFLANIEGLGLKIPEPLLQAALQHGILPAGGSGTSPLATAASSPDPQIVLTLALRILGGLQQLESVRQVIDSNLFKADYFKSSAGLISSLLSDITPRPNPLLGAVPGNIPVSGLPVDNLLQLAPANTTGSTPSGATVPVTDSRSSGMASSVFSERLNGVLQFLNELGPIQDASGRERLALLGSKIQQIQQALVENQGATTLQSASTSDPSRLADQLIREALARGVFFDLDLKDRKNPETMARLASRLSEVGALVNDLSQPQEAGTRWRVTVPGPDPRPSAPPVALDSEAHMVAESKAKATAVQARGEAGGEFGGNDARERSASHRGRVHAALHARGAQSGARGGPRAGSIARSRSYGKLLPSRSVPHEHAFYPRTRPRFGADADHRLFSNESG